MSDNPFLHYQETARDADVEPLYAEIEDPYTLPVGTESAEDEDRDVGVKDEGIWLEGDGGFSWEDTRWEQWKWEAEQGIGEDDIFGEDYQARDHEGDKDKEEDEVWE